MRPKTRSMDMVPKASSSIKQQQQQPTSSSQPSATIKPPTSSSINISFRKDYQTSQENLNNDNEINDMNINWQEIDQTVLTNHPFFNLNIKNMAEFLEQNYRLSNYTSARDRHDIEFLIELGKDDNVKDLKTDTKNSIKKRMALFYYVIRFGWITALDQMRRIEANQLGLPPVTNSRSISSSFNPQTSRDTRSMPRNRSNPNLSPYSRTRF